MCAVSDTTKWKKTELSGNPNKIFGNINQIPCPKKWNNFQHHILLSILRFVTARNYFAHHSFQDGTLNNQAENLTEQILISCLESVIYMDSVVQKISSNNPTNP